MINEHRFDSRPALFATLLDELCQTLSEALEQHSSVTLFVSGGSTPVPLYEALAKTELDWGRVTVALVDERWVAPEHEASNEALIRKSLLQEQAASAEFHGMYLKNRELADAAAECNRTYGALAKDYSLCILGMGPDGHAASLFPHAHGLQAAMAEEKDYCVAIEAQQSAVTGKLTRRMSMTPHAILKTDKIFLLLTGEEKWQVYQQALHTSDPESMPVSLFLQQQQKPIELYWSP